MNSRPLNGRLKSFNRIMYSRLGSLAETLAKQLLTADGFEVGDFSFVVSSYMENIWRHVASETGQIAEDSMFFVKGVLDRQKLWNDMVEKTEGVGSVRVELGVDKRASPVFREAVIREFVDELIEYKKSQGGFGADPNKPLDLGGEIDLIARKGGEIFLIEVKSAKARLLPMQVKALEIARRRGIKTSVLRVNFDIKFVGAELFDVETNEDIKTVNNLP